MNERTSSENTSNWVALHNKERMPLIAVQESDVKDVATTAPTASLANISETDYIDDDVQISNKPYPGIDDGFFEKPVNTDSNGSPEQPNSRRPSVEGTFTSPQPDDVDGRYAPRHPHPTPQFPYAPGYGPDLENGIIPDFDSIPDVNQYQHKKTLAQGMMDLALFSANANQLRYVLESYERHPYYYPSVVLISFSIVLQIAIGLGLILNSRYNVKNEKEICVANKINNYTVIGIFLVTAVNVFVSAFGVANIQVVPPPTPP